RKAAAEMRARVTQALRGESAADDPCAGELRALAAAALRHGAARGWNLEQDPGALRIQTIDSFTYWLASQLPIAARSGGALRVTETPRELYRRAARRTLLAAEADAVLGADTELLFERLDNHWNNVERLLAGNLAGPTHRGAARTRVRGAPGARGAALLHRSVEPRSGERAAAAGRGCTAGGGAECCGRGGDRGAVARARARGARAARGIRASRARRLHLRHRRGARGARGRRAPHGARAAHRPGLHPHS